MIALAPTPFGAAVEALRLRSIVLRQLPGEYSVNFHKGAAATEYRTDELADAWRMALRWARPRSRSRR